MNQTRFLTFHLGALVLLTAGCRSDTLAGTSNCPQGTASSTSTVTSTASTGGDGGSSSTSTPTSTSTVTSTDSTGAGGGGGSSTATATATSSNSTVSTAPALDLLFMIDNSPGMEPAQNALSARISLVLEELKKLPGGLPDLHVAVVSSDAGTGAAVLPGNCSRARGDDGRFLMRQGCGADGRSFLTTNGPKGANFSGNLADVLGCMVKLGTDGCGYEQPLESVRRALSEYNSDSGLNPWPGGFLRKNAVLGIVLLTDEDDCSVPSDSALFIGDVAGESTSLRCARAGHVCHNEPMPTPVEAGWSGGPVEGCSANGRGDSPLTSLGDFESPLHGLKDGSKLVVAGIFGWPVQAGASVNYEVQLSPVAGYSDRLELVPVCMADAESGLASARVGYPGLRLRSFVQSFGRGYMFSICDDMDQVMSSIGSRLAEAFR